MIVELVFASVLLDGDIAEADDERFDRFNSWLIIDRFGQRTGHGRWSMSGILLMLLRYPAFDSALDNDGLRCGEKIESVISILRLLFFCLYRFSLQISRRRRGSRIVRSR